MSPTAWNRKWQRLRALTPEQRRQLAVAASMLPLIKLALALLGFERTRRWLIASQPSVSDTSPSDQDIAWAQEAAAAIALAGPRWWIRATCLPQALLLQRMLQQRGLKGELNLGARKRDGVFEAHAWISLDGIELGSGSMDHQSFSR